MIVMSTVKFEGAQQNAGRGVSSGVVHEEPPKPLEVPAVQTVVIELPPTPVVTASADDSDDGSAPASPEAPASSEAPASPEASTHDESKKRGLFGGRKK